MMVFFRPKTHSKYEYIERTIRTKGRKNISNPLVKSLKHFFSLYIRPDASNICIRKREINGERISFLFTKYFRIYPGDTSGQQTSPVFIWKPVFEMLFLGGMYVYYYTERDGPPDVSMKVLELCIYIHCRMSYVITAYFP